MMKLYPPNSILQRRSPNSLPVGLLLPNTTQIVVHFVFVTAPLLCALESLVTA